VLLGPDSVGQFMPTAVKTIQRKRASVNSGEAGQSVSSVLLPPTQARLRFCQICLEANTANSSEKGHGFDRSD